MAEHLTEEEQVAAIKQWWNENGTSIVVSIVIALGGVFGWNWYQDAAQVKSEAASALFSDYIDTRENSDSGDAMLAELESSHPGSGYQALALFYQASDALKSEDLDTATARLKKVIAGSDSELLSSLAILRLAKIQHQQGLSDDALNALTQVKGDGFVSLAAELKGDILLSRGDAVSALAAYELAQEKAGVGLERPLLEMKIADLTK